MQQLLAEKTLLFETTITQLSYCEVDSVTCSVARGGQKRSVKPIHVSIPAVNLVRRSFEFPLDAWPIETAEQLSVEYCKDNIARTNYRIEMLKNWTQMCNEVRLELEYEIDNVTALLDVWVPLFDKCELELSQCVTLDHILLLQGTPLQIVVNPLEGDMLNLTHYALNTSTLSYITPYAWDQATVTLLPNGYIEYEVLPGAKLSKGIVFNFTYSICTTDESFCSSSTINLATAFVAPNINIRHSSAGHDITYKPNNFIVPYYDYNVPELLATKLDPYWELDFTTFSVQKENPNLGIIGGTTALTDQLGNPLPEGTLRYYPPVATLPNSSDYFSVPFNYFLCISTEQGGTCSSANFNFIFAPADLITVRGDQKSVI